MNNKKKIAIVAGAVALVGIGVGVAIFKRRQDLKAELNSLENTFPDEASSIDEDDLDSLDMSGTYDYSDVPLLSVAEAAAQFGTPVSDKQWDNILSTKPNFILEGQTAYDVLPPLVRWKLITDALASTEMGAGSTYPEVPEVIMPGENG